MFQKVYWDKWLEGELRNYVTVNKNDVTVRKFLTKKYLHFDDRIWLHDHFKEFEKLLSQPNLIAKYQFAPLLKMIIKTPRFKYQPDTDNYDLETKSRPISYASHSDAIVYSYYSYALTKQYEAFLHRTNISDCVLAYRSDLGKCNIQFAKEAFDHVKQRPNAVAIAIDISGYFDNIDHKLLRSKWSKIIEQPLPADQYKLFRSVTQYSYCVKNNILTNLKVSMDKLNPTPSNLLKIIPGYNTSSKYDYLREKGLIVVNNKPKANADRIVGIPQGSPISSVLSNIYLVDFDKKMNSEYPELNLYYRRYCDDILIVCEEKNVEQVMKLVVDSLTDDHNLKINKKKLEIIKFVQKKNKQLVGVKYDLENLKETKDKASLQYLGFEFNGSKIFIRPSSLSKYYRRMKARVLKAVNMAYSDNARGNKIFIRKILRRYSHLGTQNFISYAYNASKKEYTNSMGKTMLGLDSPAIRQQLAKHMEIMMNTIESKTTSKLISKAHKGKYLRRKKV